LGLIQLKEEPICIILLLDAKESTSLPIDELQTQGLLSAVWFFDLGWKWRYTELSSAGACGYTMQLKILGSAEGMADTTLDRITLQLFTEPLLGELFTVSHTSPEIGVALTALLHEITVNIAVTPTDPAAIKHCSSTGSRSWMRAL